MPGWLTRCGREPILCQGRYRQMYTMHICAVTGIRAFVTGIHAFVTSIRAFATGIRAFVTGVRAFVTRIRAFVTGMRVHRTRLADKVRKRDNTGRGLQVGRA